MPLYEYKNKMKFYEIENNSTDATKTLVINFYGFK